MLTEARYLSWKELVPTVSGTSVLISLRFNYRRSIAGYLRLSERLILCYMIQTSSLSSLLLLLLSSFLVTGFLSSLVLLLLSQ
jgi:hypothetical protein